MRRSVRAGLVGLTLLSASAVAQTEDRVGVRYLPGYPLPSRSVERIDVRIERTRPPGTAGDQDVDRFFAAVEATLSEYRVTRDWQLAIPDAPSIEITIELNGRRIRLTSAHVPLERGGSRVVTERGVEALGKRDREAVLSQQSEAFRRHRLAFERLLDLALQRAQARLTP